jgi:hypothetical protein
MPGAIDIASAVQTISEKRYHSCIPTIPVTRLANARSRFAADLEVPSERPALSKNARRTHDFCLSKAETGPRPFNPGVELRNAFMTA